MSPIVIFPCFIYSADRDGCSGPAFHAKCDYHSPVIAVASNTAGYVFGGYAPMPWFTSSSITTISAPTSFLFRLRKANEQDYMKFAAVDTNSGVRSCDNRGPNFGNTSNYNALIIIDSSANITKKSGENFFTCDVSVDFKYGYKNNGQDNNALHGGDNKLINVEVYTVEG